MLRRLIYFVAPLTVLLFLPNPLRADEGSLHIKGTKGAHVWVDGRSMGHLPLEELRLPPGKHTIRAEKRGFEGDERDVWLRPPRGATRVFYLHKKTRRDALWRSLFVPGWGQYYNDRPKLGAICLLVETAVLAYGWRQNDHFEAERERYEKTDRLYRMAVTDQAVAEARALRDDSFDKMASYESNRNRAWIGAAALYGLAILDAMVRFPFGDVPEPGKVVLAPDLDPSTARVGVAWIYRF